MTFRSSYLKFYLLFAVLFLMLTSFRNITSFWADNFVNIEYHIQSNSLLEVNGKTNVNSFCCTSDEKFDYNTLSYKIENKNPSIYFQNTRFDLSIKELDCGKKKINKDLFKALKVEDYPNISIDLKEVFNHECTDLVICGEWLEFEAITDITITCETRPVRIPILVKRLSTDSYRITGGTTLRLCDFEVKAPTAMLGLIKVKDDIDFNFDLYVDIKS